MSFKQKLVIGKKIKIICKKFNVKFLINDDVNLTKELNADGCHLGQKDIGINEARKLIGNKIIGITCHNSITLAKAAIKNKANYLAFGAFNSSKTKKIRYRASISLIKKARMITKTPIVAIGGINESNYKSEDGILILRTFLQKAKRLLNLYEKQNENTNLDILIDNYRPPIFWKDKPIIKKQLENWSMQRIKDLIININKTEEFLKKNSSISLMLVFNFIYETSNNN